MILLRTSIFLLILFLLPDWYIYKVYIKEGSSKLMKRLHWLPTAILTLVLAAIAALCESIYTIFSTYLVVALCVSVPKLVFVIISVITHMIARIWHCKIPHKTIAAVPAVMVMGYIIFGAVWGKEYFQVKEVTYSSHDLPWEFDGYRILQLSDIHSGSWTGNGKALSRAIDICNSQKADMAVFTGDLVNSRSEEMMEFMHIFSRLKTRDGVYSILGNHDYGLYWEWPSEKARRADVDSLVNRQRRMGWQMLLNENRIIHRGNDSIALIGVENCGNPPFPDLGNLPEAMKGTEGMYKVLLSHDPTHWRRDVLPDTDINLTLSGHTHDMQISIMGFSASRFVYPEHNGLYMEDGRGLYVNIGLGYVLFPMRLGAWPEITVITLKKEE